MMSVSIDLNKLRVTTISLNSANLFVSYLFERIPRTYYRAVSSPFFRRSTWLEIKEKLQINAQYFINIINTRFDVLSRWIREGRTDYRLDTILLSIITWIMYNACSIYTTYVHVDVYAYINLENNNNRHILFQISKTFYLW